MASQRVLLSISKKAIALILVFALSLSLMPLAVLALETEEGYGVFTCEAIVGIDKGYVNDVTDELDDVNYDNDEAKQKETSVGNPGINEDISIDSIYYLNP